MGGRGRDGKMGIDLKRIVKEGEEGGLGEEMRMGRRKRNGKEEEKERDGFGKDCKERGERKGSRKEEERIGGE